MREVSPVDLVQQQFVVARICQKYGFWTWREKENEQNIKMCLCLLMQRSLRQSTCTRFFLTTFCFWRKLRNRRERFVYSLIAALIKSPLATVRAALCNGLVRLSVCLSVCLSVYRQIAKTRFSQKLSNLELWSLLTTYRKSYTGFSKNPLLDP